MIEFIANKETVQISDEDYDLVQYNWTVSGENYVLKQENYRKIALNKIIAERIGLIGMIDHKDRNKLNNQRNNLRLCTNTTNSQNSKCRNKHNFKGICYHNQTNKWQAGITFDKRFINLGLFKEIEQAARAYDNAAKRLFGEFAALNFP